MQKDIAIIGMAGRFPGADDVLSFWENLRQGREEIQLLSEQDPHLAFPEDFTAGSHRVPAVAHFDGIEDFDAEFFGTPPRDAELMDPQHRAFLECCWQALEAAGYVGRYRPPVIAVFGGATINTYLTCNLMQNTKMLASPDMLQLNVASSHDFLTTRVSYKLDLHGESHVVQSACSTSLVAVSLACRSLQEEHCDMALAGAVSINLKLRHGYDWQPGGILSPDGHCRPFDAQAQGTVFGSGVGVIVLKKLETAIQDRDPIHAVIKGSAINNDGALKVGYTAPSMMGQMEVISQALANAGVEAGTVEYVEAHGTGTRLGDPIEVEALTRAFRRDTENTSYCALGSVKGNVGHLDAAAGMAGLIKAVLAVQHGEIPPTLHFQKGNPEIDFARSPFYVNTSLRRWERPKGHGRRAGVSAFGVGGTNAHVVVEEGPAVESGESVREWEMVVVSGRSEAALEEGSRKLSRYLQRHEELKLADVAYTLQVGRKEFVWRKAVLARSVQEAAAGLESPEGKPVLRGQAERGGRPVVFLFPGQGSQRVGMGARWYREEPVFREEVDRCSRWLEGELGLDLREILCRESVAGEEEREKILQETWLAQPALFVMEYVLARTWMEKGVSPEAMLGHSLGEYVAACVAGVFGVEEGLRLVARRGRLMQGMAAGAMVAVSMGEEETQGMCVEGMSVAAVNAPQQCVLSGAVEAVVRLERRLEEEGVMYRRLETSHAFHCPELMGEMVEQFRRELEGIELKAPRRRYLSNVTGRWIREEEATSREYWIRHLQQTVRCAEGMSELLRDPNRIFLEVGPGDSLIALVKRNQKDCNALTISPSKVPLDSSDEIPIMSRCMAALWVSGGAIDWTRHRSSEARCRVSLPTYPFQGEHHWIHPGAQMAASSTVGQIEQGKGPGSVEEGKNPNLDDWFHFPSWKRQFLPAPAGEKENQGTWLLFSDLSEQAQTLEHLLVADGSTVFTVQPGNSYKKVNDRLFTINPKEPHEYTRLIESLPADFKGKIIHLWTELQTTAGSANRFREIQFFSYHSILNLAKSLELLNRATDITVLLTGLYPALAGSNVSPEKSPVTAACKVINQESSKIRLRCIDISGPQSPGILARMIIEEILSSPREKMVAIHGLQRFVQVFEPVQIGKNSGALRSLPAKGTFLITGGFGGVGCMIAEFLARKLQARIILTTRVPLPKREDWAACLEVEGGDVQAGRRIRQVLSLEALGAEVLVADTDITDPVQLDSLFNRIDAAYGDLNGIFHVAGVTSGPSLYQPFTVLDLQMSEIQFEPKVYGVYALRQCLVRRSVGFCCLFSSTAALLGGLGYLAYAAANSFMDAFAESTRNNGGSTCWISINWDPWPAKTKKYTKIQTSIDRYAMSEEESLDALMRVIQSVSEGQVAIVTGDLARRMQTWLEPETSLQSEDSQRPALETTYEPPSDEIERKLVEIWERLLGIKGIGIHDSFFDLGGHSLLATRLIGQVREEFHETVAINSFFMEPTLAAIAKFLKSTRLPPVENVEDRAGEILSELQELSSGPS